jgi:hypothetical protein
MKGIFVLIIITFSLTCFAQKKEQKVVLGYACGYSGSPTDVIIKFANLLHDKKYESIKAFLFSKVPAENFLAIVICKRLAHKNIIKLTEIELKKISELYKSKEKIPICGGCTYSDEIELYKILNSKPEMFAAIDYFFHDEK